MTIEDHEESNAKVIRWLFFLFGAASACLIYEAVAWVLILKRG